jgi:CDP-glucose 4,6-dehydratase
VLLLDSARARDRLGWAPRWSLPEALTHIAAWERARLAGADMQAVTLAQIDAYAVEAHRQAGFSP